jgi:hypothetical protein
VSWTDGPIGRQVQAVANDFGGIGFDPTEDRTTYHRQKLNDADVQYYCYRPDAYRKISMEFAGKIRAAMLRQDLKCPDFEWCNSSKTAEFKSFELSHIEEKEFYSRIEFFTLENVDTLNFRYYAGDGCYMYKLEYDLIQEVMFGIPKLEIKDEETKPYISFRQIEAFVVAGVICFDHQASAEVVESTISWLETKGAEDISQGISWKHGSEKQVKEIQFWHHSHEFYRSIHSYRPEPGHECRLVPSPTEESDHWKTSLMASSDSMTQESYG